MKKNRTAYTLFEVLIALGLTSVLMVFVLAAIDIHLRQLVVNRTEVEEAQLARTLLENIAKDIRSAVVSLREEQLQVDTEALSALFGFSTESFDADSYLAGMDDMQASTETESGETEEETLVYGTIPGIYGSIDWIQIDTAKLPRGEMFGSKQIVNGSLFIDRLSPSKTVLYYLGEETGQIQNTDDSRYQPDQLIGSLGRSLDPNAIRYGLFRRQLDRMVTQYAVNEGKETEYEQYDEPLAPEVEWIEFAFYEPAESETGGTDSASSSTSGTETGQWLDYWDMDEMQKLPTAVRITLAIRRQNIPPSLMGFNTESPQTIIYSLVVPIPVHIEPPAEGASQTGTATGTEEGELSGS